MVANTHSEPAPPIGIIESLTTGFETVAARIGLILLPFLLDLFLWLGPHISIRPLIVNWTNLIALQPLVDEAAIESREALSELLRQLGANHNVFAWISTAPLGVPSLMAYKAPTITPIGSPTGMAVESGLELITLVLAFSLLGLLLGTVYFSLIAHQLRPLESRWSLYEFVQRIWINWSRLVAFSVLLLIVLGLLSVPLLLLTGLAGLISPILANIFLSLCVAAALWLMLYIVFVVHGIVLQERGLLAAFAESIRLVHNNLSGVLGLFVLVFIINWGLSFLWTIPQADSWLLLAGIAGHAYVVTGLVTATFIFYKDRYRWWNEVRAYILERRAAEQAKRRNRPYQ